MFVQLDGNLRELWSWGFLQRPYKLWWATYLLECSDVATASVIPTDITEHDLPTPPLSCTSQLAFESREEGLPQVNRCTTQRFIATIYRFTAIPHFYSLGNLILYIGAAEYGRQQLLFST